MAYGVNLLEMFFAFIGFAFGDLLMSARIEIFWLFGIIAYIVFLFPKDPSWKKIFMENMFFWAGSTYGLLIVFNLLGLGIPPFLTLFLFLLNVLMDIYLPGTKFQKHSLGILMTFIIGFSFVVTYF